MSYWSHNPELLDEITTEELPEPWRTQVIEGEVMLSDVPDKIFSKAMDIGVREYWAGMADEMKMRAKDKKLQETETDFVPTM